MVFPRARVVVAACLFLGWLGYLAYLVAVTRDLIVVSRPQILVAEVGVVARIEESVDGTKRTAKVIEVLWPKEESVLAGATLELNDLIDLGRDEGWTGTGEYLLALSRLREGKTTRYQLTPLPPMPGLGRTYAADLLAPGKDRDRVAEYLQKEYRIDSAAARALVNEAPTTLKRFVPADVAFRQKEELTALGADVEFREYPLRRIYRATDDVIRQVRDLKPAP